MDNAQKLSGMSTARIAPYTNDPLHLSQLAEKAVQLLEIFDLYGEFQHGRIGFALGFTLVDEDIVSAHNAGNI